MIDALNNCGLDNVANAVVWLIAGYADAGAVPSAAFDDEEGGWKRQGRGKKRAVTRGQSTVQVSYAVHRTQACAAGPTGQLAPICAHATSM